MSQSIDIGTQITRSPDIRGRPIIAGTGVTVRRIVCVLPLSAAVSAEDMQNRIAFLSAWP